MRHQALVGLGIRQQLHGEADRVTRSELARAQGWRLNDVSGQAVLKRRVQRLRWGGGVEHRAIGALGAHRAAAAFGLAGDAGGLAQGAAKSAPDAPTSEVGPSHGSGGFKSGAELGDGGWHGAGFPGQALGFTHCLSFSPNLASDEPATTSTCKALARRSSGSRRGR